MMRFIRRAGVDLPLALLAFAVALFLVVQMVLLVRQSQTYKAAAASQDGPLQETARLRQATDALAADIAQLAQQGNASAKQVVDDMARQNITLRPPTPAGDNNK